MPYTLRKLPRSSLYRVTNKHTGKILAYRTTYKKARSQLRLLKCLEKNRDT